MGHLIIAIIAPARAVREMAAISGFGMLSHSAMVLSKNPPL
jgi:hypothetical protein